MTPDGTPYWVFYCNNDNKHKLIRYTKDSWEEVYQGIQIAGTGPHYYYSLYVTQKGQPYVAFANIDEGNKLSVYTVKTGYLIKYDKNGDDVTGTVPSDTDRYAVGENIKVKGKGDLVKPGHVFAGWNTQQDGKGDNYNENDTLQMKENGITLYAKWVPAPAAEVADVTIAGTLGQAIEATDIKITLTNDSIKDAIAAGTELNWITNLPTGLTAKAKETAAANATQVTLVVEGTPLAASNAILEIKIPGASLNSGQELTVTQNANARFDIKAAKHAINVNVAGGTADVTTNPVAEAAAGETVTVNIANIETGKQFKSITVKDAENNNIATTQVTAAAQYTFTMPAKAVTVIVELETKPKAPEQYTVTFSVEGANGTLAATVDGTAINSGDQVEKGKKVVFTVAPAQGYRVKEWKLDGTVVPDNRTNTYTVANLSGAINVTVEFEAVPAELYTVTFDSQGGSAAAPITDVAKGSRITAPPAPTRGGYTFAGWYKEPECINRWNFDTDTVTGNITLYAKWTAESSGGDSGDSGGSSESPSETPAPETPAPETPAPETPSPETASEEMAIQIGGNDLQDTAVVSSKEEDGKKTVSVVLNTEKMVENIDTTEKGTVVTIPVTEEADTAIVQLDGKLMKHMEDAQTVLEVKTGIADYTLPLQEIDMDAVQDEFDQDADLSEVDISIEIKKALEEIVKIVEETVLKEDYSISVPAVSFSLKCTYKENTVKVREFKNYVKKGITIPEESDPEKITTAVIVEEDGTLEHVPTKVTVIDGKYYARINSRMSNCTYSVIWNPVEFKDVSDHWAKEAANDMGSRLVIEGAGDDMFVPDGDITRAEFAAIIIKALGLRPEAGKTQFTDVSESDWYSSYINTASRYNIIFGYGDGKFGPNDKINREQVMTMIARAMDITGLKIKIDEGEMEKLLEEFRDADILSDYAKDNIAKCVKGGIITGKSGKLIAPKDNTTRGESAMIVRRLLKQSDLI